VPFSAEGRVLRFRVVTVKDVMRGWWSLRAFSEMKSESMWAVELVIARVDGSMM
jgi:hypothetical protein